MSLAHNPKIVTDGLVLCLDAANPKSYPGSGTSWSDLSKGDNNSTLLNGVGFDSDNRGALTFDGVDDYISGTLPTFSAGSSVTIEAVVKLNDVTGIRCIFCHGRTGTSFSCGMVVRGSELRFRNSNNDHTLSAAETLTTNTWYHLILSSNGVQTTGYVNGNTNGTTSTIVTSNSLTDYSIGRRSVTGGNASQEYVLGNISFVKFYVNKAFTESEVKQNFAATRGRYGI